MSRNRLVETGLYVVAVVGPVLFWAGYLTRGLSMMETDIARLVLMYAVMACSAGAAARIPVAMAPNLTTTLKELKKQGVFVLGLAAAYGLGVRRGPVALHLRGFRRPRRLRCSGGRGPIRHRGGAVG